MLIVGMMKEVIHVFAKLAIRVAPIIVALVIISNDTFSKSLLTEV